MKRDNFFWGGALILFGVLFLLQTQGYISNMFVFLWPLILMLIGGWLILSVVWQPAMEGGETFVVPLQDAKSVSYQFAHGASQIQVRGDAPVGQALVGSKAVGMNYRSRLSGDRLDVRVEAGPSLIPVIGPSEGVWRYQLARDVPSTLKFEAGASSFDIDLKDMQASRIEFSTGASSVNMILPARGASRLEVGAGAASFNIRVPDGTAARIRLDGFTAVNVDTNRFPQNDSGTYESPNFDSSPDRTEIVVEAGATSVTVK